MGTNNSKEQKRKESYSKSRTSSLGDIRPNSKLHDLVQSIRTNNSSENAYDYQSNNRMSSSNLFKDEELMHRIATAASTESVNTFEGNDKLSVLLDQKIAKIQSSSSNTYDATQPSNPRDSAANDSNILGSQVSPESSVAAGSDSTITTLPGLEGKQNPTNTWSSAHFEKGKSVADGHITSQDVLQDLYLRPGGESDRRKERERQQRYHYFLKRVWKNELHRAELEDPKLVIELRCGIGLWSMEMATKFPNTQVIGVDFKGAALNSLFHALPNLEFRDYILNDSSTGLEEFESNSVDYIMMRDNWISNSPLCKWDNSFKEAYRILKPGGWIEVVEHELYSDSKRKEVLLLHKYFDVFCQEVGVDRRIANKLGERLEKCGFDSIAKEVITLPVGEWGATVELKETGFLFRDLIERRLRVLSKWIAKINHVEDSEVNELITKSMESASDKDRSTIEWVIYLVKKPVAREGQDSQEKEETNPVPTNTPPPLIQVNSREMSIQ